MYHIYPRSFMDSNADGIGDIPGIVQRLDYVKSLGVTAIWLSPFYRSPMADFGYDVADYCDVDPIFGTLDDFKTLLAESHIRDIKVMIDLVPNHTSDAHKWFQESRKSRDVTNPFRDWYVWHDGIKHDGDDRPESPNNWRDALTGGSAWEWDAMRSQYYLHSFDVRQPDLNWSNPAVRAAIKTVMRFWLDLGVDGFRVDAVYWMAKEPLLSDDPVNTDYVEGDDLPYHALKHDNSRGWPAVYAYLSEMADVLHEEKYTEKQRFMVTEAYPEGHNPLIEYLNFFVGMDPKVAAPFIFEGLSMQWKAATWRKFLKSFYSALHQIDPHCVSSFAFGNHDQPRIASRLGDAAARSAAVLLLTLPGMVFLYYGDEIGMRNVAIPRDRVRDPAAQGEPETQLSYGQGRDPERTPMQWTDGHNAGFSEAPQTWLPIASDYTERNVVSLGADPTSLLSIYRTLGTLRTHSTTLKTGGIHVLDVGSPNILGFIREHVPSAHESDRQDYVVLVNFTDETTACTLGVPLGSLIVTSYSDKDADTAIAIDSAAASAMPTAGKPKQHITLRPHEAVLYEAADFVTT